MKLYKARCLESGENSNVIFIVKEKWDCSWMQVLKIFTPKPTMFRHILAVHPCLITLSFKDQWLLCVPPGSVLKNLTFCPHSAFMCFVWISEWRAIIVLCNINWFVFITNVEYVYCQECTKYSNIIQMNLSVYKVK